VGRTASLLVVLAGFRLVVRSTHAPYLPELLAGMHAPRLAGHSTMAPA
jgi:hypothetical protein